MDIILFMCSKSFSEWAQGFAFTAAGCYFLWKFAAGYLISNLSIEPTLTRQRGTAGYDDLLIDLKLIKGDRESLILTRIQLNIKYDREKLPPVLLKSPQLSTKNRMIRMSPGEYTQFAHLWAVPTGVLCYIEVEIEGYGGLLAKIFIKFKGYWKISLYSLPNIE